MIGTNKSIKNSCVASIIRFSKMMEFFKAIQLIFHQLIQLPLPRMKSHRISREHILD